MNLSNTKLFERLGGMPTVEAAVEIFYTKVLEDDRISHFFRWTSMKVQVEKQKRFLAYIFGAPMNYTGKSLRDAHSHLWKTGLNEIHYNAVVDHLLSTLYEMGIADELSEEVRILTIKTKDDVLGR